MTTVVQSLAIRALQLSAQIAAVKLEQRGMKRKGRSASAMLKEFYGLPKSTSYDVLLESLRDDRANVQEQLANEEQFGGRP